MSAIGTTPFGQETVETAVGPTKTMVLNMGPQHPSTHGVLRILLELDGETVLKAIPDLGYLHTGIEKSCEDKTYSQAITLTDRMDYLNRDSFFTGVSEGIISSDRIIKMLNVKDDHIVIEEKGIYSVEKFIIARRLMYWQVYLHKTVIAAEQLLVKILERSRELVMRGEKLFAMPALNHFLVNNPTKEEFLQDDECLEIFTRLDDTDILSAIKVWAGSSDRVLAKLCTDFVHRKLFHVDITNEPANSQVVNELTGKAIKKYNITKEDVGYFVFTDTIRNNAYKVGDGNIRILMKDGSIKDIAAASDNSNLEALAKTVKKYILCYSKDLARENGN